MYKFSSNTKFIILVILVSFFVGGFAGVVFNFLSADLAQTTLAPLIKILSRQGAEKYQISQMAEESATISSVKKITPSVVSIAITKELVKYKQMSGFEGTPFEEYFGSVPFNFGFDVPSGTEKTKIGGGTGFIVSPDGMILTNRHVVEDEEAEYTVITSSGKTYNAKILAADTLLDLAIIKIDAAGLPVASLGDSDKIEIGQTVISIGNALSEYPNTVTKGIVSAQGRRVLAGGYSGSEIIEEAIQIDAAINPGNSGGPIVDLQGNVIGIATAMTAGGESIGFAIPVNAAKKAIESVQKFGKILRPWLGVRYVLINQELKQSQNLPFAYGAWIIRGEATTDTAVVPGSPADKAGLEENNIILEVGGVKVDENHSLSSLLSKYNPGDEVDLKVYQKGEAKNIKVKLEERKE